MMKIANGRDSHAVGPRAGVLYPDDGCGSQSEYLEFSNVVRPKVKIDLALTETEPNLGLDNLRETGSLERLIPAARRLVNDGAQALMWACTSGSFVAGRRNAERQREELSALGVPSSSTSLSFVDALRELGISRVSILSPYPADVTEAFVNFLAEFEIRVRESASLARASGPEVAHIASGEMIEGAGTVVRPDTEALLLPCTAIISSHLLGPVQEAVGVPVLFANQVTLWNITKLLGLRVSHPRLGVLSASSRTAATP